MMINGYLSGGMMKFGKDEYEKSNGWRKEIQTFFHDYWNDRNRKFNIFNPNDHFNFADDNVDYNSDREVMEIDLYHLRKADIVIVNFNDPFSLGTMAEIAIAYELKKPIIGINFEHYDLHPWQKEMCNIILESDIMEVIEYIIKHYL